MTDLREALKVALDTLERCEFGVISDVRLNATIQTLRQALAQPEHEPVACVYPKCEIASGCNGPCSKQTHTAPPKREWVGLTDAEVEAWRGNYDFFDSALVREVEAKLKDKNS